MTHFRRVQVLACVAGLVFVGVAASQRRAGGTGCPASDRTALVSARAGATRSLVPSGAFQLRLCRYGGANSGAAFRLFGSPRLITDAATVARFAHEFDDLNPTTGIYHCPLDSGAAIVAQFRYRTGVDDPVTVGLDGCMTVTNGRLRRTAGVQPSGRALIAALRQLAPAS